MRLKRHLHYAAEAKWDHKTGGTAQLDGFTQRFDTPREHGGNETAPCPDQLFATSLAGCIIDTFNYYRVMLEAETIDFKVNASMDIELTDTAYKSGATKKTKNSTRESRNEPQSTAT